MVKDPVSLRYYRFKEHERFLIRMMDGTHTLDEAQKEFEKKFRPQRLPLEELESFAQQLLTAGLAHNEFPQSGKQLFDRRKKRRRREWLAALTNILYIKIPIYDPDKLLNRMLNQGLFPTFLKLPIQIMFWGWLLRDEGNFGPIAAQYRKKAIAPRQSRPRKVWSYNQDF